MIVPIILAGGSGTRLWPLSREDCPKQFIPLFDGKTLFEITLERIVGIPDVSKPIVISNKNYLPIVKRLLNKRLQETMVTILEPFGKNTAPAITIAALHLIALNLDPILLVLPADHVITDLENFYRAISEAIIYAQQGYLVCFGIKPSHPETGYGYIKFGSSTGNQHAYYITEFVEKPNLELAQQYVASQQFFWNSGMFMFQASNFLQAIRGYAPDILLAGEKTYAAAQLQGNILHLAATEFAACRSASIDYAVMEHMKNGVVVAMRAGWSDVGSWKSLWEQQKRDDFGNVKIGNVIAQKTTNCYIHSSKRKVIAIGVADHIIVETENEVLVVHKNCVQDVKKIVEEME
jgi:mannose-1-phosphate guanylyltransferase/mannose-6-phosphate isomerase